MYRLTFAVAFACVLVVLLDAGAAAGSSARTLGSNATAANEYGQVAASGLIGADNNRFAPGPPDVPGGPTQSLAASAKTSTDGTYTVRWGDTLWRIAVRHGTTVAALKRHNGLVSDRIYAGQILRISGKGRDRPDPDVPGGRYYIVQWGDTLWRIARTYGTTVGAIMRANTLRTHRIYAGQVLWIPIGGPAPRPTPVPRYPEVVHQPWSGPPGTLVTVEVVNFPPWTEVQLGVGPYGSEFSPIDTVVTDGSGRASTHVRAEGSVGMNLVIAARSVDASGTVTYASALFRIR